MRKADSKRAGRQNAESLTQDLELLRVNLLLAEQRARDLEQELDTFRAAVATIEARAEAHQRDATAQEGAAREARARLEVIQAELTRERSAAQAREARLESLRDELSKAAVESARAQWLEQALSVARRAETTERERAQALEQDLAEARRTEAAERGRAQALEQQLSEARDGEAAERTRVQTLGQDLSEVRRRAASEAKSLREAAKGRDSQLRRMKRALAKIRQFTDLLARSERWRIGGALVGLYYRLSLREAKPDAVSKINDILSGLSIDKPDARPPVPKEIASKPSEPASEGRRRPEPPVEGAQAPVPAAGKTAPLPAPVPVLRPLEPAPGSRAEPPMPPGKRADIVICVHNALADVKECVDSVANRTHEEYHLILVNDGSDEDTSAYLRDFAAQHSQVELIENPEALGYTRAANQGMRASDADYVVLLNSDTVVTYGWLPPLLECGESDSQTGIVSPVSNAATWQSVPKSIEDGKWAENPLPWWMSVEDMGALVAEMSDRKFPQFPFLNGFCLGIKRAVIDRIGLFDEEKYPIGYCEETDYCLRAAKAGFSMRVADHCFVLHKGSRSFTSEGRHEINRRNYQILLADHGKETIDRGQDQIKEDESLDGLRRRVGEWAYQLGFAWFHRRLKIIYLLGTVTDSASGGVHMIVDSVAALCTLGTTARLAIAEDNYALLCRTYPDQRNCFVPYRSEEGLADRVADFDVIVITHFKTAGLAQRIRRPEKQQVIAYYIQDFEPWIVAHSPEDQREAQESYTLIPGTVHFAMTNWIRERVKRETGVTVHKVEPGFHHGLYQVRHRLSSSPVTVSAMVRPRTPRRNPEMTLRVLKRLKDQFGEQLRIVVFGCDIDHPIFTSDFLDFEHERAGLLSRRDLADILAESDIFLDCSTYQAYGLTGVEAMSCGSAVVLPKRGGASAYAVDGHNALLADTNSEDAVFEAVARLVADTGLRERLSRNGRRDARRISLRKLALSQYLLFYAEHERQHGRTPAVDRAGASIASEVEALQEASLLAAPATETTVTLVMPIYNAADELDDCLRSVLRHTPQPYRLVLIDDASTDLAVQKVLANVPKQDYIHILRNEQNLGFVRTANRGMSEAEGDVVLLNSDVTVFEGWLDSLRELAYCHPWVASVTPLSNTGAYSFVPKADVESALAGWPDMSVLAERVRQFSLHRRIEIATGIGYCMYLRRSAIDRIGLFDEEAFGRGYGEENDWCCRALEQGFLHLLDDATFVYHAEAASFSLEEKAARVQEHVAVIRQRYPYYQELIDAVRHGSLKEIQDYFRARLCYERQTMVESLRPVVLRAAHLGGGGSFEQFSQLSHRMETGFSSLLLQAHSFLMTPKYTSSFLQLDSLSAEGSHTLAFPLPILHAQQALFKRFDHEAGATYAKILDTLSVDLLHVHHFIHHYLDLVTEAHTRRIPYVVTVHDFFVVCPRFDLVNHEGRFCGVCEASAPPELCLRHPHMKSFHGGHTNVLQAWRLYMGEVLNAAARIVCPSESARELVSRAYPILPPEKFTIIEHGAWDDYAVPAVGETEQSRHDPADRLRVAYVGDLAPRKGSALFLETAQLAADEPIEFHHYGAVYGGDTAVENLHDIIRFHGPYERKQIVSQLAHDEIDLAVFPGIWPETYCHALTECILAGVPVVTTAIGAVAERVARDDLGWVVARDISAEALLRELGRIRTATGVLAQKANRMRAVRLKGVDQTVEDYASLYRDILAARSWVPRGPHDGQSARGLAPDEFLRAMKLVDELELR